MLTAILARPGLVTRQQEGQGQAWYMRTTATGLAGCVGGGRSRLARRGGEEPSLELKAAGTLGPGGGVVMEGLLLRPFSGGVGAKTLVRRRWCEDVVVKALLFVPCCEGLVAKGLLRRVCCGGFVAKGLLRRASYPDLAVQTVAG